jgi:hypothetical protein
MPDWRSRTKSGAAGPWDGEPGMGNLAWGTWEGGGAKWRKGGLRSTGGKSWCLASAGSGDPGHTADQWWTPPLDKVRFTADAIMPAVHDGAEDFLRGSMRWAGPF